MQIKIFSNDLVEYSRLLEANCPQVDIYYRKEFLMFDAVIQKGIVEVFTLIERDKYFFYPYVKLSFNDPELNHLYDITSSYGYGGPLCNCSEFFKLAEKAFLQYANDKFVTEFVRYHYLYNKELKFAKNCINSNNRTIVVGNIELPANLIFSQEFSSTNRNLFKKLNNENYKFDFTNETKDWEKFVEMYYATMDKVGANGFYYFDKEKILSLKNILYKNIVLAKVHKDDITFASALFFLSGETITYYLSARNLQTGKVPASNFLLSNMALWGASRGFKYFNYGGGLTNSDNDSLFKFKKEFSKNTYPFTIGKRIHNQGVYQKLSNDFIIKKGEEEYMKRKAILQFYR